MSGPLLLPLALLAMAPQDPPCPPLPQLDMEDEQDWKSARLSEPSGAGLWIGGMPVAASELRSVGVVSDEFGGWRVEIVLSDYARARFAWISTCRLQRPVEISLDGKMISRPVIREPILSGTIGISGYDEPEQALVLAKAIKPD